MTSRFPFVLAALILSMSPGLSASAGPDALPRYSAADPTAPLVTASNLVASERFWPYQVELVRAWTPEGREKALPGGSRGVLVRVEASGLARIDFGRDGRYEVPLAETDLLARANRIRTGELSKISPNFVHVIGARMVDSAAETIRPVPYPDVFASPGFLAVFADPEHFEELASSIGALHERHGVWTVLFPQGVHADPDIRRQLRALDWPVPFLRDQLSDGYTRSRLAEGTPLPSLMLVSREGRVLWQQAFGPEAAEALSAAIDSHFGAPGGAEVAGSLP